MSTVLSVQGLGKAYRRYGNPWNRVLEWISFGRAKRHTVNWVLKGIDFEVQQGEALGIIGQNGAGKSTLLKLITGTTRATTGTVRNSGRVSALLELGMGFHPDFTGRQNAFMAGQLLGYGAEEIALHMGEIESFAEIGSYIDQPVRTYSSGMQVRLAFSVATMLRPELLIVDEALSVGDAYFQHKCFARIRRFKEEGTTLLFVSHDPGAVKTLCDRALLLDGGLLVKEGAPDVVLDYYNALIAKREAQYKIHESGLTGALERRTRSGNERATIVSARLFEDDVPVQVVGSRSRVTIRVTATVNSPMTELTAGILIRDRLGNDIFGTNSYHHKVIHPALEVGHSYEFDFAIAALNLGVGSYNVSVALHSHATHVSDNYDWWDHALVFQVISSGGPFSIGSSALDVTCECAPVELASSDAP